MTREPLVVSTQRIEQSGYSVTCVTAAVTDDNIDEIVTFANKTGSRGLLFPTAHLTTRGVSALGRMKDIRYLSLKGIAITDEVLATLPGTGALETLALVGTSVRGDVFANLPLPKITLLDLCETRMDDRGVKNLRAYRTLRTVRLSNTRITMIGLSELAKLPALEIVWAQGCGVTVFALAETPLPARLKVMV